MPAQIDTDGGHSLSLLADAWDKAAQHWHDEMARDFDVHHVRPLLDESRTYLDALRDLIEVLDTATRDTTPS
ncbi:MAG: hypothetical protein JO345_00240 [Streptosporangiaceae bacterium]|nr:hypothetical protein [Streptosporangiaceae bacterium]